MPSSEKIDKPLKIGIFGGSFNPPTTAHLALARYAHDILKLDQIWWMVAPLNPFKPKKGMADFDHRFAMCELTAADDKDWLMPTDIEQQIGTQQTADTLKGIRGRYPQHSFVWLMGTDNLMHFHLWDDWQEMAQTTPIAVFSRPTEQDQALLAEAAIIMAEHRRTSNFDQMKQGEWALLDNPSMDISATHVRALLAAGQSSSDIIPAVAAYISEHNLYQNDT